MIEQGIRAPQNHEKEKLDYLLQILRGQAGTRAEQNAISRIVHRRNPSFNILPRIIQSIVNYTGSYAPISKLPVNEALTTPSHLFRQ